MKKSKRNLFMIILLFLLIISILFFTKFKDYKSQKELYDLCQNINNYNNLHIHEEFSSNRSEYGTNDRYWKDNIYVYYEDNKPNSFSYLDKLNNLCIYINEEEKNVTIYENETNYTQKEKTFYLIGGFFSDKKWKYIKYNFCGIENVNGQECYKISLSYKPQEGLEERYWIEKNMGLIIKQETCWPTHIPEDFIIETRVYSYEFDCVTNKNTEKPDIKAYEEKGYEIIYK